MTEKRGKRRWSLLLGKASACTLQDTGNRHTQTASHRLCKEREKATDGFVPECMSIQVNERKSVRVCANFTYST